MQDTHSEVQDYYGKTLQTSDDLKTNACCTDTSYPDHIKKALSMLSDEVITKYYGCGLCVPTNLEGLSVLDLGSGSGRDCYILSHLVGESGKVVGVDMTPEQLEVSRKYIGYHQEKFGFSKSNVEFIEGNIERLDELGFSEKQFDLIVSNCVLNLATDKYKVLKESFRTLSEGGEFYFSDVYCDRRIPDHLVSDPVLYGECLSGALYWNDFVNIAKKAGFADPRLVESRQLTINNKEVEQKLEGYKFYSATYRLFKLKDLEPDCEDFGQAIIYKGGILGAEKSFTLDEHHIFEVGKVEKVCGNTWHMLKSTRLAEHFTFVGNFEKHYGIFEGCGKNVPFSVGQVTASDTQMNTSSASSCC